MLFSIAQVEINIPELNPEMVTNIVNVPPQICFVPYYSSVLLQDVYRIGTLMELVRTLALSFADDGKCVKVNCQFWIRAVKLVLNCSS